MKLAYLGDAQSNHTLRWVRFFAEAGHTVSLLSFQKLREPLPRVNFVQLTLPNKIQGIKYLLSVRNEIRTALALTSPDILHAHYVSGYGHSAWLSGFRPYVLTAWGSDLYLDSKRSYTSQFLTHRALKTASVVTADSADLIKTARKLGAQSSRLHNIQFGVDTDLFQPQPPSPEFHSRLHIPENTRILLSPRGLQPGYNIDKILQAFALLAPERSNLHLLIKDFNSPPNFRQKMDQLVQELNLQKSVSFLQAVEYPELPLLHNLADVEISIPTSDGTPVTVLEALACGRLVVACNLPSLQEWIKDGENGWLVDPANPQEIANAVRRALEVTPARLAEIQQKNIQIIHERGSHQANMRQMERLYRMICPNA